MAGIMRLDKATRIVISKTAGRFHLPKSASEFTSMAANAGKYAKLVIKMFSFI